MLNSTQKPRYLSAVNEWLDDILGTTSNVSIADAYQALKIALVPGLDYHASHLTWADIVNVSVSGIADKVIGTDLASGLPAKDQMVARLSNQTLPFLFSLEKMSALRQKELFKIWNLQLEYPEDMSDEDKDKYDEVVLDSIITGKIDEKKITVFTSVTSFSPKYIIPADLAHPALVPILTYSSVDLQMLATISSDLETVFTGSIIEMSMGLMLEAIATAAVKSFSYFNGTYIPVIDNEGNKFNLLVAVDKFTSTNSLPHFTPARNNPFSSDIVKKDDSGKLIPAMTDVVARDWDKRIVFPFGITKQLTSGLVEVTHSSPGTVGIMGPSVAGKTTKVIRAIQEMVDSILMKKIILPKQKSGHLIYYVSTSEPDAPYDQFLTTFKEKGELEFSGNYIGWKIMSVPIFGPGLVELLKADAYSQLQDYEQKGATIIIDSATLALFSNQPHFPFSYSGGAQKEGLYWPMRDLFNVTHLLALDAEFPIELIMIFNVPGEAQNFPLLIGGNIDHILFLSGARKGEIDRSRSFSRHVAGSVEESYRSFSSISIQG
jgi:hypothetical protein